MSERQGFIFYPKDWWTSDTFFELDEHERYIYLECLFMMYQNGGFIKTQIKPIENRLRTQIKPNVWEKITQRFILTPLGYTSDTIIKRLGRRVTNRLNGLKGGRPKSDDKKTQHKPKPPFKRKEKKRKENNKKEIKKSPLDQLLNDLDDQKKFEFYRWLDYRTEIKKSITNMRTLGILKKRFAENSIDRIREVTGYSIENNYQGLFWDRRTDGPPKQDQVTAQKNLNDALGL